MTDRWWSAAESPRKYRARIGLFLGCVVAVVLLLSTVYQCISSIRRLEVVESERDQWQKPSEIIQTLNINDGSIVGDLGSGAGYFSLKLSSTVGKQGKVFAVDIRRLPLLFLRVRAFLENQHNISTNHADTDNPNLPPGVMDAVLVVNTYHELAHPRPVLGWVFRSLVSGGRLVIVDREPLSAGQGPHGIEARQHALPRSLVEEELQQGGFEVVDRKNPFTEEPGHGPWWLLVARKP